MNIPAATSLPNDTQRAIQLGVWFAALHFGAFLISAMLALQGEGWAGVLIWPVWLLIDFPVSLFHWLLALPAIDSKIENLRSHYTLFDFLLYSPYLVHGVLGTIWWGFMPRVYFQYRQFRARK